MVKSMDGGSVSALLASWENCKNIEVKSCVQIFTHFYANFASIRKVIFATQGIDMMKEGVGLKLGVIYKSKNDK